MKHNIYIKGHAFSLRPIELSDAQLIVKLRTTQPERSQFIHPIPTDVSLQESYLQRYFNLPNDYYFVVERIKSCQPEGLIGIYDLDKQSKSAEWGRWILAANSLAAIESCWLIYQVAFKYLQLQQVYCRTIAQNQSVVSFHDSCGLSRNQILPQYFKLGEEQYDAIEHILVESEWESVNQKLEARSQQVAGRLNR